MRLPKVKVAGLVMVLLIVLVEDIVSHSDHDATYQAEADIVGIWNGTYHDIDFTLVIFPTGDYTVEMFGRVAHRGTWRVIRDEHPIPYRIKEGMLELSPGVFDDYQFSYSILELVDVSDPTVISTSTTLELFPSHTPVDEWLILDLEANN